MIIFDKIGKFYGQTEALKSVSFKVRPKEFVVVVGPSGAGKSTLMRLLTCEEKPSFGRITINGRDIHLLKKRHIPYYRRQIGVVYQDFKLLPQKTVFENVAFALEVSNKPPAEIEKQVNNVLKLVGLEDKKDNFPHELSGGEAQRVAIARALIFEPRLLLADEPTGNLDPKTAWEIIQLLLKINQLGTTVILATHNKDVVNRLHKRVVTLINGQVVRDMKEGRYDV
jgi:cell division transport system ATP-binding protein